MADLSIAKTIVEHAGRTGENKDEAGVAGTKMTREPDDPSRFAFFERIKRAERERLERMGDDVEERKRWMLKCASGGGMQHHSRKKNVKVSLAKMSWEK